MLNDTDTQEAPIEVTSESGPYAIIPAWVLDSHKLSGTEWGVYIALRTYANSHREAHPKIKTIAARLGVTERSVERAIEKFEQKKLLTRRRVYRPDGRIAHCVYKLIDVKPGSQEAGDEYPDENVGVLQAPRRECRDDPDDDVGDTPTTMSEQEQNHLEQNQKNRESADADASARTRKAKRATKRTSKPLTTIPSDFAVTEDMRRWAETKCPLTAKHGGRETDKFRNYYEATGRKHRDWIAAWRNWFIRAEESAEQSSGGRYGPHGPQQGGLSRTGPREPVVFSPTPVPDEIIGDPVATREWALRQRREQEKRQQQERAAANGGAW